MARVKGLLVTRRIEAYEDLMEHRICRTHALAVVVEAFPALAAQMPSQYHAP